MNSSVWLCMSPCDTKFSLSFLCTLQLGYTRLNLAEFAGVGAKERRCLLQAYDTNNYKGHDNSILLVSLCVTLQYGDPVYLRYAKSTMLSGDC